MKGESVRVGLLTRLRRRLRIRTRLRRWSRQRDASRAALPRVFCNSLPKAGTHLLLRCVTLMPGLVWEDVGLRGAWLGEQYQIESVPGTDSILVGLARPAWVRADDLARVLRRLGPGEVTGGHMPYSASFADLLRREGIRSLLILRDPRDVVVSLMYHLRARPRKRPGGYLASALRSDEEGLRVCIEGTAGVSGRAFPGIAQRLGVFLPWLAVPEVYATRFEKLIGPQGSGGEEDQEIEIRNIAQHLGLSLTSEQVRKVASGLFGRGLTFRRGQIASWKDHFQEEHKAAFKRLAGQHLIEMGYERDLNW